MKLILGSRSPRRQELLTQLFPEAILEIEPPHDEQEEPLAGEYRIAEIEQGVIRISESKARQVHRQRHGTLYDLLLTADTVVAVRVGDEPVVCRVLGKPDPGQFPEQVRRWFEHYYWGKSHLVMTGICLMSRGGNVWQKSIQTEVQFCDRDLELLDWYLAGKESLGKAGGYAIQGLGSLFVQQVTGSLSNVVGLPLKETRELIIQAMQTVSAE